MFLGISINKKLKWAEHSNKVVEKAYRRMHALRVLKRLNISTEVHAQSYIVSIGSILIFISLFYSGCTVHKGSVSQHNTSLKKPSGWRFRTNNSKHKNMYFLLS